MEKQYTDIGLQYMTKLKASLSGKKDIKDLC